MYQYFSQNIITLIQKTACFPLDCFSNIYTRIYHKKLQFLISPQIAMNHLLKKSKKANVENSFFILAMKMKEI